MLFEAFENGDALERHLQVSAVPPVSADWRLCAAALLSQTAHRVIHSPSHPAKQLSGDDEKGQTCRRHTGSQMGAQILVDLAESSAEPSELIADWLSTRQHHLAR